MRLTWPLTGRSEELQSIGDALTDADVDGVVVNGGAGVGKSRIAREALAAAASHGARTRWVVATASARELPLGAFSSYVGADAADTLQLVRGVISTLTADVDGAPVLVAVDDVHLVDALSAFVLQQLVHRRIAKVLLTVRSGEPVPVAVQEILWHERFHRIDLQPISRDETTALVSAALAGRVAPDTARKLWELTRGNVLYLRNIVAHELGGGRLVDQRGYWTWTGEPDVPSNLVEAIEATTGALSPAVADVIDVLAVGEPLELPALRRLTDSAAIEDAESRGLIELHDLDGRVEVRVRHPLYAEVRRKQAPAMRLRRLRGAVATELGRGDDRDDMRTVVRRATLSLDSDLAPDPDLLVRAAHGATWMFDLPLADRLADAAVRAGGGPEAYLIRGCNLSGLSRGEEADELFADLPTTGFTGADHARLAFIRGMNLMYTLADPGRAKHLVDEVAAALAAEDRACTDAFGVVYWATMGKPQASHAASQGLNLNELPAVVGAKTASKIALSCGDAGRVDEADAAARLGYGIVDGNFDAESLRFGIADTHVGALVLAGRIPEAMLVAEQLRRQSADLPGIIQPICSAVAGRAALGAGDVETARALLEPVDLMLAARESNGWGYRFQLPRISALAMLGPPDSAGAALAGAEERRHPVWQCFDYELALARAWVAAARGVVSSAITLLRSAAEVCSDNGQFAAEVLCLQTATQFGDTSSTRRLDQLAGIVEGPRAPIVARFADALSHGDGAGLEAVSTEFEQMGDRVAAVDAAAHAAAIYRRQQLRGSAYGCTARADALAAQCGSVSTPALRSTADRLSLTEREREIVLLIGEGLSNRAVADQLCLSVRTVEGHIYRAMAKADVGSREELALLLPRKVSAR